MLANLLQRPGDYSKAGLMEDLGISEGRTDHLNALLNNASLNTYLLGKGLRFWFDRKMVYVLTTEGGRRPEIPFLS